MHARTRATHLQTHIDTHINTQTPTHTHINTSRTRHTQIKHIKRICNTYLRINILYNLHSFIRHQNKSSK